MDVTGVGFGRTGTLDLKVALAQLGLGPCMHMIPVLGDEQLTALFQAGSRSAPSSDGRCRRHRSRA